MVVYWRERDRSPFIYLAANSDLDRRELFGNARSGAAVSLPSPGRGAQRQSSHLRSGRLPHPFIEAIQECSLAGQPSVRMRYLAGQISVRVRYSDLFRCYFAEEWGCRVCSAWVSNEPAYRLCLKIHN